MPEVLSRLIRDEPTKFTQKQTGWIKGELRLALGLDYVLRGGQGHISWLGGANGVQATLVAVIRSGHDALLGDDLFRDPCAKPIKLGCVPKMLLFKLKNDTIGAMA